MGESLYLAFFIWAVALFRANAVRGTRSSLTKCGLCLAGACLTRYDGWFLRGHRMIASFSTYFAERIRFLRQLRAAPWKSSPSGPRQRINNGRALAPASRQLPPYRRRRTRTLAGLQRASSTAIRSNLKTDPTPRKLSKNARQTAGNPGHPGSRQSLRRRLLFLEIGARQRCTTIHGCSASGFYCSSSRSLAVRYIGRSQNAGSDRLPLCSSSDPAPVLRSIHRLRRSAHLHPAMVAVHALQHPLRIAAASRTLQSASQSWHASSFFAGRHVCDSQASLQSGRLSHRRELRFDLALQARSALQEAQINMRTRRSTRKGSCHWLEKLPDNATLLMYLGDHVGALERAAFR